MAIEVDDPNGPAAVPISPLSNGSSNGQAAVLETLGAQLTWLDGDCIEFAKQAPRHFERAGGAADPELVRARPRVIAASG